VGTSGEAGAALPRHPRHPTCPSGWESQNPRASRVGRDLGRSSGPTSSPPLGETTRHAVPPRPGDPAWVPGEVVPVKDCSHRGKRLSHTEEPGASRRHLRFGAGSSPRWGARRKSPAPGPARWDPSLPWGGCRRPGGGGRTQDGVSGTERAPTSSQVPAEKDEGTSSSPETHSVPGFGCNLPRFGSQAAPEHFACWITESLQLEKTSEIIKPNRHRNPTTPAKPCPKVPHPDVF